MPTISLDASDLSSLSSGARKEVLALFQLTSTTIEAPIEPAPAAGESQQSVDLSLNEARRLIANLGSKSRLFLKTLVKHGGRAKASVLAKAVGESRWQDLGGVQRGITVRTRTVTGDEKARLLYWDEQSYEYDDSDEFVDGDLCLSDMSCASLAKVL